MIKIKNNLMGFIASIIVILIPILVGVLLWNKLPDQVALHFNFQGEPDDYYSKAFAVFGFFPILLAMQLMVCFATGSTGKNGEGIPDKLFGLLIWIIPTVTVLVSALIYGRALGYDLDVRFWMLLFVGILFLVLGNYAPKARRNPFFGLRVKWTMESKKNWDHSNRFSAKIMCGLGLLFIIFAFLGFNGVGIKNADMFLVALCTIMIVSVFAMIGYSYVYYIKHKDDEGYYS